MIDFISKEWKNTNPKISILNQILDSMEKDEDKFYGCQFINDNDDWLYEDDILQDFSNDYEFILFILNKEIKKEYKNSWKVINKI